MLYAFACKYRGREFAHILQCYSEGDIGSQYSRELGVAGAQLEATGSNGFTLLHSGTQCILQTLSTVIQHHFSVPTHTWWFLLLA